ncbi:MAG: sigma-70 family RNA polymerase sigma factor [Planctomycetota bacterium]|nr:sigma-70 family RNA polymerase sigma factor [Planctomycetota bacterium]
MLNDVSTGFVDRLRARDPKAWFELWETFGPILRAQLRKWGKGRIGVETVQDLSQETLAALSQAIDTHDPSRGARFSTWLLAIARYTLSDEIDRRMAMKRGSGVKPTSLDESFQGADPGSRPDDSYELAVFDAKVDASLRQVEREADFVEFAVYRMRVLEGKSGKGVAAHLGMSEPTVSRRLASIREALRTAIAETVARYSFTKEEEAEALRNGVHGNPNKVSDVLFDEAVAEVYHRLEDRREAEAAQGLA